MQMNRKNFNNLVFTDEQINDELIDVLIKAGAQEYIQNSTLEIPSEELSDIEFSNELDKKILKYFDDYEKNEKNQNIIKFTAKVKNIAIRAAAALFVLVVLAFGFVATSEAAQIKLLNMYIEFTDIDTRFFFGSENDPDTNNQNNPTTETVYSYIPFGFELVYEDINPAVQLTRYEGIDGGFIEIHQMKSGNVNVNAEDANSYMTEVDGVSCYVTEHEEINTIICEKNELFYLISSDINVDEMLKIVSGINN